MARRLDLSQLTADEAQHVFHVVQRDMSLRKKEDERLGELKCRIADEETKRRFLTKQAKFNESHCILCLEPFQFLMNSKRRCLDCSLNICKTCSKFNKKTFRWVCDSCRIARIVKTASLDWFYNHVKSRFTNNGSAAVMRSLNKRDQSVEKHPVQHLDSHCEEGEYDQESDSYLQCGYNPQMMTEVIVEDEDTLDYPEDLHYRMQRRNKRLLSVHHFDFDMDSEYTAQSHRQSLQLPSPHYDGNDFQQRRNKRLLSVHHFDFDMDSEYTAQSRRQSLQLPSPHYEGNDFQSFSELSSGNGAAGGGSRKGSLVENPELSFVFRSILQEKSQNYIQDQLFNTEVRFEINTSRQSLDKLFNNEEAMHREQRDPHCESIPEICVSTEDADQQQLLPGPKQSAVYFTDFDSSDNDEAPEHPVYHHHFVRRRSQSSSQENSLSGGTQSQDHKGRQQMSSPARSEASGLDLTDADLEEEKLKKKLDELASNISDRGPSSDDELRKRSPRIISSSNEDLHIDTAKVSEIENRIAALNAAGMNTLFPEQPKIYQDAQAKMVSNPPARKSSNSTENSTSKTVKNEACERNIQYKGSLTQRNPRKKTRRLDQVFGKPVMSMKR
ncbi:melanophilin isoform X3 [Amblyraja radiata]|uniref:melanophilin isoform X3 n=1 Tax=Amblyraja radiata TaxID=386614 RepID=UPI0014034B08|nr:melanophilin isoform X3 [Amblyraja radiata]